MLCVLTTQQQLLGCLGPAPKGGKGLSEVAGLGSQPETQPTVQGSASCVPALPQGCLCFHVIGTAGVGELLFWEAPGD